MLVETSSSKGSAVQSVDRAVSVMEFLSRHGWSGVSEVAGEIGIHRSSAYRIITTLKQRGLVEQDTATGKYRLGFGMVMLASAVRADLDIMNCARPICESLCEQTGETVTVATLEGEDSVIIHQSISRSSALSVDWIGVHSPLHATASGKILLVYMPAALRRRILRRPLDRYTEHTITEANLLEEQLEEIRREDYGYTVEELEVGLTAVGSPIRSPNGEVIAAMSLSGPSFRMPAESVHEAGEAIREAAADISRCLGYSSSGGEGSG